MPTRGMRIPFHRQQYHLRASFQEGLWLSLCHQHAHRRRSNTGRPPDQRASRASSSWLAFQKRAPVVPDPWLLPLQFASRKVCLGSVYGAGYRRFAPSWLCSWKHCHREKPLLVWRVPHCLYRFLQLSLRSRRPWEYLSHSVQRRTAA